MLISSKKIQDIIIKKPSLIRTDMYIREQRDREKNVHIVKHQDTHKEHVPTLLDCALLVINLFLFL